MLFTQFLLGIAHVRLSLARDGSAGRTDLTLYGGHRLTGGLAHHTGYARNLRAGARTAAELLDPLRHPPLVILGLGQVLAQALLVGLLLGQSDVGREVGLKLGFLGMGFVEPLDQLGITRVQVWHLFVLSWCQPPRPLALRSSRWTAFKIVWR